MQAALAKPKESVADSLTVVERALDFAESAIDCARPGCSTCAQNHRMIADARAALKQLNYDGMEPIRIAREALDAGGVS